MQFSRASVSSSSGRRQSDPAELDVFDASRYFSGCIEGVGFGFDYNSISLSSHRPRPIAMNGSLEMMDSLPCHKVEGIIKEEKKCKQPISPGRKFATFLNCRTRRNFLNFEVECTIKEEKKCKQPISPGRKFATFLNSLFQQTPSRRKKKQKSLEQIVDQSKGERTPNSEHKGKKIAKSLKSMNSSFGERKWILKRNGDEFVVRKREEDGMRGTEEQKIEENIDHESDSSSDLFELKSYDFHDFNFGLPSYQTTKAGVIKRGSSVIASVAF